MSLYWIKIDLNPITGTLIQKKKFGPKDINVQGGIPCEEGRDQSDASISQRIPSISATTQR